MKNPPHTYLQKLRSYLDPAVPRKVGTLSNILCCPVPVALLPQSHIWDPLSLVWDCMLGLVSSHSALQGRSKTVKKETAVYMEVVTEIL